MRQVPVYLILGDGRLARHLQAFLGLEALSYLTWSRKRKTPAELTQLAEKATHILIALSDSAIEPFLKNHPFLLEKTCVHFSGALVTAFAPSAHPLMTFSGEAYTLEKYRSIPFVIESGRAPFSELLPGLTNPHFEIGAEQKTRYHAFCVMSGNFPTLLWEKTFAEFAKLGLPKEIFLPYLSQVTKNLADSHPGQSVLTGPLVRGDQKTIERHLAELGSDSYADVYRAFVSAFRSEQTNSPALSSDHALEGGPA